MQTIRKEMMSLLEENPLDARALSSALGLREKEVYPHLAHIQRSLKAQKKMLVSTPYHCQLCGFIFKDRKKLHPPGRCPRCKQGSISPALYTIK
jgi:hypothetical protein